MLVGCAYGDAMGMPSEMMNKDTFKKAFPNGINTFLDSTKYDFMNRKFVKYEVTDDTINTLILCDSIIKNNGNFVLDDYLQLLRNWIYENPEKNQYIVGPSTKKAIEKLDAGYSILETGMFGTTNGSCMKVSPLGIICDFMDLDSLIKTVKKICLPTHNTSIAIGCTSIIVAIVSYILRGGKNIDQIWELVFQVEKKSRLYGNQLPSASLKKRLEIVKSCKYSVEELQELFGAGMEAIETLPMVLAILMESHFDPQKSALLSANLYGDTDTIGSISTAISGAYYFNFPIEDIKNLEKINKINFSEYADKLITFIK